VDLHDCRDGVELSRVSILPRWILLGAAALSLALVPGCKKETAPETQVTVQASIRSRADYEHITADAV